MTVCILDPLHLGVTKVPAGHQSKTPILIFSGRSLNKARKWELEHQSNCRSAGVGANFPGGGTKGQYSDNPLLLEPLRTKISELV